MKKLIIITLLIYNTHNAFALNIPIYGALFIYGKDTLATFDTFISMTIVGAEIRITSDILDMCFPSCLGRCYSPTWLIENDSVFLVSLLNDDKERTELNLQDIFKERCVNGRVFAKEITYKLSTHRYTENSSNYDTDICFTIKNGIVIDHDEFKNKTEYASSFEIDTRTNTDWNNLPDIAVDRLVTIKIKTNEKGELVSASVVKNRNNLKPEGEDVWKQEALRQVKLVSKWDIQYECGEFVNNEREIEFLFSKQK
jgi:hypothetical protein